MATILIVDDFSPSQRLMRYILNSEGHRVIIAADGEEALERLYANNVDIVITDWYMPKMNGRSFVQHVRADTRFQTLPIVVLTASGDEQDAAKAEAAGVTAFLTKPIASEKLLGLVGQLIAVHPDQDSGSSSAEPGAAALLTATSRPLT